MMRSSALSLALGYIVLGIAALVLFAAPLYYAWQVTIQDGRSEILQADALRLTDVYRHEGGEGLKNFIDARVNMQIAGDRILLLTDASLKHLAGNLAAWPGALPPAPGNYRMTVDMGGERGVQETLVHVARLGDYLLLVGRDNKLFAPLERRFWYGLTAAIAVLCIAGLLVGLITRRALMSRVYSIRQTVSAIIHGDLKHRLPTDLSQDELNTLASTINGMLEQIEQLVHGVRNVSNSIAHDLRTPLAELRSRLEELALIRPPPEATFAEIDGAVSDVDRVIRIFDALLRLAEIDAGLRRSGFVCFDVVDLAATAVEFYAPAAELKNVRLQLHAEATIERIGRSDPARTSTQQLDRQRSKVHTPRRRHRSHHPGAGGRARRNCRDGQRTWNPGRGKIQGGRALLPGRRESGNAGRRARLESRAGRGKASWKHARAGRPAAGTSGRSRVALGFGSPGGWGALAVGSFLRGRA